MRKEEREKKNERKTRIMEWIDEKPRFFSFYLLLLMYIHFISSVSVVIHLRYVCFIYNFVVFFFCFLHSMFDLLLLIFHNFVFLLFSSIFRFFSSSSSRVAFNFALLCVLNASHMHAYVPPAIHHSANTHTQNLLRYNTHNTHRDGCYHHCRDDVQSQFPFLWPRWSFLFYFVFSLPTVSNPPADGPTIKFEHKWRKPRQFFFFNFKIDRKPFRVLISVSSERR